MTPMPEQTERPEKTFKVQCVMATAPSPSMSASGWPTPVPRSRQR